MTPKPQAAIVGMGDAYASVRERKDPLQLAVEATYKALADAGIGKDQIDAVFTGRSPWADKRSQWSNIFCSHMQMPVTINSEITMHGAGLNATVAMASQMIAAGRAQYVLCLQSDATELFVDAVAMGAEADADPQFEIPYGPTIPSLYAQAACRYFHEFGITEEDLADVSIANQKWAVHHPHAAKARFGEIDRDKVLASPYVATPLRRWMCSTWGGGTGGALVVTSVENAKIARDAVYVMGYGSATTHEYLGDRVNMPRCRYEALGPFPNLTYTATAEAARQAYQMSQLAPADIDMAQISVNFAHMGPIIMEDLGFATKGQGISLYREGRTGIDGDLPTDTNGGWLSFGQPGISCNMDSYIEAIRQLRGQALGRAANKRPRTVLVQGSGGMLAAGSVTILSSNT
ncbi:acetyl-CoA acetyltransferase [Paraburkholderia sp. WC7.3g]|uniref:Thiolase family protein n=1 Tax=Paraburkholderia podalyriae TaxID=1938811 RepID=A0ABR7PI22_9BURK|nr:MULTISPECIES: thiolase family protein [Paraburkholderia]MBB5406356.1 acetyl-CoA acetyltransferase [Paraburkholderia sp. HC6.4b]MBB5448754.1 acetyl-CoA acetyltransferase [Paraburkholderia sp. Kb1A]MBC8745961.1 thiolase family protein [Paraburkholderia podalyriae]